MARRRVGIACCVETHHRLFLASWQHEQLVEENGCGVVVARVLAKYYAIVRPPFGEGKTSVYEDVAWLRPAVFRAGLSFGLDCARRHRAKPWQPKQSRQKR